MRDVPMAPLVIITTEGADATFQHGPTKTTAHTTLQLRFVYPAEKAYICLPAILYRDVASSEVSHVRMDAFVQDEVVHVCKRGLADPRHAIIAQKMA